MTALTFHDVLPADAWAPRRVRHRLRAWLEELCWPGDDADDLILAVNEAVSNVVDHAYPADEVGFVWVDASLTDGPDGSPRLSVIVADNGRWQEPASDPGYRQRGIRLMRGVTEFLHIDGGQRGTRVEMTSQPSQRVDLPEAAPLTSSDEVWRSTSSA